MAEHRGVMNFLRWHLAEFAIVAGDRLLLRIAHRKVPQQYLVDQREDSRVAADPKSDGDKGDRRKAGAFGKRAHTHAQVLQTIVELRLPARGP